jgi:hypothetical protein
MRFLRLESAPDSHGWTSTVCLCEDCAKDVEKLRRCGVAGEGRRVSLLEGPCRCNQCSAEKP